MYRYPAAAVGAVSLLRSAILVMVKDVIVRALFQCPFYKTWRQWWHQGHVLIPRSLLPCFFFFDVCPPYFSLPFYQALHPGALDAQELLYGLLSFGVLPYTFLQPFVPGTASVNINIFHTLQIVRHGAAPPYFPAIFQYSGNIFFAFRVTIYLVGRSQFSFPHSVRHEEAYHQDPASGLAADEKIIPYISHQ